VLAAVKAKPSAAAVRPALTAAARGGLLLAQVGTKGFFGRTKGFPFGHAVTRIRPEWLVAIGTGPSSGRSLFFQVPRTLPDLPATSQIVLRLPSIAHSQRPILGVSLAARRKTAERGAVRMQVRSYAIQFAAIAMANLICIWGATQWVAYDLGFQEALGAPPRYR